MIVTLSEKCRQLKEILQVEYRVAQSQLTLTKEKQNTLANYRRWNEKDTGADIKEIYRKQHLILEKLSTINQKQIEMIQDTKRNQDSRFEEELSNLRDLIGVRNDYSRRIQKLLRLPVSAELVMQIKELLNEKNSLSLKQDDFDKMIRRPMYMPSSQTLTKIYGEFLTKLETYILVYSTEEVLSPDQELQQIILKREPDVSEVFVGFSKERLKQDSRYTSTDSGIGNEVFTTKEINIGKGNYQKGKPVYTSTDTLSLSDYDISDSVSTFSNQTDNILKDERSKQLMVPAPRDTQSKDEITCSSNDDLQRQLLRIPTLLNISQGIILST